MGTINLFPSVFNKSVKDSHTLALALLLPFVRPMFVIILFLSYYIRYLALEGGAVPLLSAFTGEFSDNDLRIQVYDCPCVVEFTWGW
jgi:hypothetical protein